MARNVPCGKRTRPELVFIVPPAVKAPQAMALAMEEDADVDMNRKCSVLLAVVTLVPATTAARQSAPAAAPRILRMVPPVISAADCGGTLARPLGGGP